MIGFELLQDSEREIEDEGNDRRRSSARRNDRILTPNCMTQPGDAEGMIGGKASWIDR